MALLDVLKQRLDYEYGDKHIDQMLSGIAEEGKAFLSRYCPGLDFEGPTIARSLLVEYVRYSLSNALDDFSKNYHKELFALSNRGRVLNANGQEE